MPTATFYIFLLHLCKKKQMETITIELTEKEKERILEFCQNANITVQELFAVRVLEFITLKNDKEKKNLTT